MQVADYPEVISLWRSCQGIGLSDADTEANVVTFLARNPRQSAVARDASGNLVGAVLCGHDGRRGYLHHLAVALHERKRGIATRLLEHCFVLLAACGIQKCNVFLFADNAEAEAFWRRAAWNARSDLVVMQKLVPRAK